MGVVAGSNGGTRDSTSKKDGVHTVPVGVKGTVEKVRATCRGTGVGWVIRADHT